MALSNIFANKKELKIREFLAFLIKNQCFSSYCENVTKAQKFDDSFQQNYPLSQSANFIMDAFLWESSSEGYMFWKNLHELWEKEVFNKKKVKKFAYSKK